MDWLLNTSKGDRAKTVDKTDREMWRQAEPVEVHGIYCTCPGIPNTSQTCSAFSQTDRRECVWESEHRMLPTQPKHSAWDVSRLTEYYIHSPALTSKQQSLTQYIHCMEARNFELNTA